MFRVSEISMSRDGYVHGIVDAGFSNEYFQYLTDEERKSSLNFIGRVDFVKSIDGRTAGLFQVPTDDPFYLIQYTGLKDTNGKEIYEGDVVDYLGDIELVNSNVLRVIEYKNEEACFVARLPVGVEGEEAVYLNEHDFKVIGNIYENPELLGDSE